ncbi:MAG: carbohydrate ABC transporter permease [Pseudomonadota bacterium]
MRRVFDHIILSIAVLVFCGPVFWLLIRGLAPATFATNIATIETRFNFGGGPSLDGVVRTSVTVATGTALSTTVFSFVFAYALVFCRPRVGPLFFWTTLATLYFPIEARMLQTFEVVWTLGLTSQFSGLILPILPVAVGTLFFRQHFMRLPPEVLEAARIDGAGPLRCLAQIVLPMSWHAVSAVGLISFIWGWNQYLWPLMASIDDRHWTLVRAIEILNAGSPQGLTLAALSVLPPLILVILFTRILAQMGELKVHG